MKNVYHIVSNNWTSGLERVVMNICELVPGYRFVYVAPKGEITEELSRRNINHISVNKITPSEIKKIIKENKVDVIHGHDVKASLCISANFMICKMKKIKMISELHNDDERMHRISIRSILYAISSFFYDRVVCVSDKTLDNFIFRRIIAKKSLVIENVINPDILLNVYKDDNIQSDFLFLGRLEYQKNPFLFVEFISEIKKKNSNVKAYIIGKGSLYQELKKKIKEMNLDDNIIILGYKENPYNYIKSTKAVVITSRYEGLCMVALESLLIGTPLITTDVTGLSQLINDECGCKSNDLNKLVNYGNKIINDDYFLNKAHQGAIQRSKSTNNVNLFIDKYVNLYQ